MGESVVRHVATLHVARPPVVSSFWRTQLFRRATIIRDRCPDVRSREISIWDVGLGWLYGLGIVMGNIDWEPTEAAKARAIPDLSSMDDYVLLVPVRVGEQDVRLRLTIEPVGVAATKVKPD